VIDSLRDKDNLRLAILALHKLHKDPKAKNWS